MNEKTIKRFKKLKLRSFINFYPTFLPLKHDILGGDASKFHEPINVSKTSRAVNPSPKNLQVCRDASLSNFRDRSWQWRPAADPVKNGQSWHFRSSWKTSQECQLSNGKQNPDSDMNHETL